MSVRITAIIQQEENWFVAKCLENDVATQGKTIEESMDNLKEALELYYEETDEYPTTKKTFVTTLEIAV